MSYSLSIFAPEFFFAEGEPYDAPCVPTKRPVSVWQAIMNMPAERWAALAREVFSLEPEFLTPEAVLDCVRETDTCSNISRPVRVWIDSEGLFTLDVYDER